MMENSHMLYLRVENAVSNRMEKKELSHETHLFTQGKVHLITLKNEKKLNCLGSESWQALRLLAGGSPNSAIILTSAPQPEREAVGKNPIFCAGFDLDELYEASAELLKLKFVLKLIGETFETFQNHPSPVIAFIDGEAIGGGMGLVLCADYVVATPRSRFSLPQDTRMMALAGALLPLRRKGLEGWDGAALDAEGAKARGFVNEIVPAGLTQESILKKTQELMSGHFKNFARLHPQLLREVLVGAKEYLQERHIAKLQKQAAMKK